MGVMRKHNFDGQGAAHGSKTHRRNGAIGCRSTPGRIWKNQGMPGHMGDKNCTTQNLVVLPGPRGRRRDPRSAARSPARRAATWRSVRRSRRRRTSAPSSARRPSNADASRRTRPRRTRSNPARSQPFPMSATVLTPEAAKDAKIDIIANGKGTQAVHDAVVAMRANRRSGTASTKTKATVSGSRQEALPPEGHGPRPRRLPEQPRPRRRRRGLRAAPARLRQEGHQEPSSVWRSARRSAAGSSAATCPSWTPSP